MARNLRPRILRELTENPGKIMYADDLAEKLGITRRMVVTCMYNMRKTPILEQEIEVLVHGNAWRYKPPTDPASLSSANGVAPDVAPTVQPTDIGPPTAPTAPAAPVPAATPVPDTSSVRPPPPQPAARPTTISLGDSPRIFEEIGTKEDGRVLVSSEDGELYWLIPRDDKSTGQR
jgi:hypothetical protein